MSRDLLSYFNTEMAWFKRALTAFAEANPQAGSNLRVGDNLVEDPHVSRLIESVALLNSRIQARLDDDFPLVLQSLLEQLYPYYLAPKPSMLIAQFQPSSGIDAVVEIPRGTCFETERSKDNRCRFRSCYTSGVSPLELKEASLRSKPFSTPGSDGVRGANAVIELKFESTSSDFSLSDSPLDSLTLHLRSGALTWRLRDLLYANCLKVVIASSDLDPAPSVLGSECIRPLGFARDELILPDLGETSSVYQHLLEYFAYPEKHLFFRLTGLREALQRCAGSFSCYLYLGDTDAELEKSLDRGSFALHCAPLVNLFSTLAEPQRITPHSVEHLITPDIRGVGTTEVYAIEEVQLIEDGSTTPRKVAAYHSLDHDREDDAVFWHGNRRAAINQLNYRRGVTEYYLSLAHLDHSLATPEHHTLQVRCLCSNANLPANLPIGGGSPQLTPEEPLSGVRIATSLTAPTTVKRLDLGEGLLWRLLSHLNLNYLSLVGEGDAAGQLREMLSLYDFGNSPVTRAIIESVDSVRTNIVSLPIVVDGRPVVCRGIDFSITFDVKILEVGSALLLGDTLHHFLSMYVSINSFVRITAYVKGREGVYHQWEPRVGARLLL